MTFRLLLYVHTHDALVEIAGTCNHLHSALEGAFLLPPPSLRLRGLDSKAAEPTATTRPTTLSFPTPSSPCAHNTGPHHLTYCLGAKDSRLSVSTSRNLSDENQRLADTLQLTVRFDLPLSPIYVPAMSLPLKCALPQPLPCSISSD